jgi:hypothetical protein
LATGFGFDELLAVGRELLLKSLEELGWGEAEVGTVAAQKGTIVHAAGEVSVVSFFMGLEVS